MPHLKAGLQPDRLKPGLQPDRLKAGLQPDRLKAGLQPDRLKPGLQPDRLKAGLPPGVAGLDCGCGPRYRSADMDSAPHLSIVVPLYKEKDNVRPLHKALSAVIEKNRYDAEIVLVDDGSPD